MRRTVAIRALGLCGLLASMLQLAVPAQEVTPQDLDDLAKRFTRTAEMIPMRDGVQLHTLVYAPKESKTALPFIMIRTPYGVDSRGPKALKQYLKDLADDGYIFVFQDIRGRHKSEGQFVMMRPPRDPKDPKAIDEGTDTHDTIDWLLKKVPNHNGRVGMLGISYPGWTTVMALVEPHPALKAASPQAPPADMYIGDDFHHNGAFRLSYGFEYVAMMETDKSNAKFDFDRYDTFEWYLKLGSLANVQRRYFKNKMPTWNDFVAHPNYDSFWKKQATATFLKRTSVPTLNVAGWYDQEDFYGPLKTYELLEVTDKSDHNFLVVGPWNHGGWQSGPGDKLGRIAFDSDTGQHFRAKVQAPFFARYLKDKGDKPPEALMFQTGSNQWVAHAQWPPKAAVTRTLHFHSNGKLRFEAAPEAKTAFDEYVSDPAKPVPYRPRPVTPTYPGKEWQVWMVEDQRFTQHRPDVLTYETEPLEEDLTVAGSLTARLFAATSGTDSDWIVRLIDVFPEKVEKDAGMGGFQLLVSGEPARARFRKSLEKPEPVVPGEVNEYTINLHWNHHCFRKGHKIMVQVQSTWFPLLDRNPQKYVPNIFEAADEDFQTARQQVYRSPQYPSAIQLQVLSKAATAKDGDVVQRLTDLGAKVTTKNGAVTTLAIPDGTKLTDADFQQLGKLTGLKSLDVNRGLTDERLALLADLADLESLQTNVAQVSDDGLKPLARLKSLKSLKMFHPGAAFSGAGLAHLAELPQLQSVTVAGSLAFNDDGMKAVAKLPRLTEFRSWHSGITNQGVPSLKELPNLKTLNLGQRLSYKPPACPTDETLALLAELKSLEVLQLSEARLTLAALQALKKLPALKKLTLEGIELPKADVERLQKELPTVKIEWTEPNDTYKKRIRALFGPE